MNHVVPREAFFLLTLEPANMGDIKVSNVQNSSTGAIAKLNARLRSICSGPEPRLQRATNGKGFSRGTVDSDAEGVDVRCREGRSQEIDGVVCTLPSVHGSRGRSVFWLVVAREVQTLKYLQHFYQLTGQRHMRKTNSESAAVPTARQCSRL